MRFPLEGEALAERARLLETLHSLTDDEFNGGPTLCAEWAPRDVLGHLIGVDDLTTYARRFGVGAANAAQVARARELSREDLMKRAEQWAARPSATSRFAAAFLLGDLSIHHQDILRGLGRTREVPPPVAAAILREGAFVLSPVYNRRILRYKVIPTDDGRALGRGREVRGTREQLGMWLAGRDTLSDELTFA
ncbi:MAG TPA: maleylpyruvate isomerase family mycothiol-dependent enzyme [Streptosporangiaceae bacterium]